MYFSTTYNDNFQISNFQFPNCNDYLLFISSKFQNVKQNCWSCTHHQSCHQLMVVLKIWSAKLTSWGCVAPGSNSQTLLMVSLRWRCHWVPVIHFNYKMIGHLVPPKKLFPVWSADSATPFLIWKKTFVNNHFTIFGNLEIIIIYCWKVKILSPSLQFINYLSDLSSVGNNIVHFLKENWLGY